MALTELPFLFGGDYNPEQWPEETWEADMKKLQAAHINELTLNVFSWSVIQADETSYDFSVLDKVIKLAAKYGMQIVLATSTGALPAWMVKKYPDVTRTDSDGRHAGYGMRHNACPNSPHFQQLAAKLVEQIATRYAGNPSVVCWHVSNEYGGLCYCDNCAKAFREWLKAHYNNDLAAVNAAWNSNYWSHTFHAWDEIVPPTHLTDMIDAGSDKPVLGGAALDYRRFQSDSLLANFKMEKAIIRKFDQTTPITTNLMAAQKDLDYYQWAKEMDLTSWDNYPSFDTPSSETAMDHDLIYGLKQAPFMLMEQTPSQANWQPYLALKAPGELRMQSYQAVAHGARTVQFFQMKQSRNGVEKFHSAVISHTDAGGEHETRVYKEVQALGKELAALPVDLRTSRRTARVGVLFDYPSWWGVEFATGPSRLMNYMQQVHTYYQMAYDAGLDIAVVGKDSDWSGLDLLIAPVMYIADEAVTAKIKAFTKAGGTFLTTYMSGIVDEHDNVWLGGYPGTLRDVLGLWNEEWDARPPKTTVGVKLASGEQVRGTFVCEIIHPTGAKVLATYDDPQLFYTGAPAVTENVYGQGHAFYVGTQLDEAGLSALMQQLLAAAGLQPGAQRFNGIEITRRYSDTHQYTFLLNTTAQALTVANPAPTGEDLLTGYPLPEQVTLPGYGVAILQSAR